MSHIYVFSPSSAVREGDDKLIEFFEDGGRVELYNLRDDPNEEHDLAPRQPERVAALSQTLQAWQRETGAAIPRDANPAYDPKADRPRGGQPGGEKQGQGKGGRGPGKGPAAGNGPAKGPSPAKGGRKAGRDSLEQEKTP